MTNTFDSLPSDLVGAHALILAERAGRLSSEARAAQAEADLTHAQATASSADALIARLRLEIEKLRRTLYGARSERKERLIDQLEMQLEDAEADATEDELAAERASPSTAVKSFERKRPVRKPFPEHLPRERVVVAAPQSCPCCGSTKLSKLGEDVTETLGKVLHKIDALIFEERASNAFELLPDAGIVVRAGPSKIVAVTHLSGLF